MGSLKKGILAIVLSPLFVFILGAMCYIKLKKRRCQKHLFINLPPNIADTLSVSEFKNLIVIMFCAQGYKLENIYPTALQSCILIKENKRILLKVTSDINHKNLMSFYNTKSHLNCDEAVIISNQHFPQPVVAKAQMLSLKLFDKSDIENLIESIRKRDTRNISEML